MCHLAKSGQVPRWEEKITAHPKKEEKKKKKEANGLLKSLLRPFP